ncbi:MAG: hypothetical protein BGO78_13095 [Chloroflexi bacterium 44-23]|nr:MAG: hypothetical protein BGO78_13095 [Chloroflexi bacterium 44-23]
MLMRGILKPEDQLPTVRQLAKELKVNFNTVARAYRLLDEAGIISTQQGRGTYILPLKETLSPERMQQIDQITFQYLQTAGSLGFSPDQLLAIFHHHFRNWKQGLSEYDKERFSPNINVSRETN